MFFNKVVFTAALVCSASAFAVEKRQTDPTLAPLNNVPTACQSTCAVLAGLANIDPSNLSTLSAVCTPQIAQSFKDCITCFETNSPQTFTPALLTSLQSSVDQLGTGCLLIGSPVSSITVPQPTGGAAPSGAASGGTTTGTATATPTNTAAAAPATSTTSHSGATEVTTSRAGLLAVLSAIGATFFL